MRADACGAGGAGGAAPELRCWAPHVCAVLVLPAPARTPSAPVCHGYGFAAVDLFAAPAAREARPRLIQTSFVRRSPEACSARRPCHAGGVRDPAASHACIATRTVAPFSAGRASRMKLIRSARIAPHALRAPPPARSMLQGKPTSEPA